MNEDNIVCTCLNVTNGMIREAVEAGANTLEEVEEKTGAGTVCGACLNELEALIRQYAAKRDA